MSDAATEARRTEWFKGWPSFEIFRTFRMAIHPSKLGLALLGIALTGLWGTLLDSVWPGTRQPVTGELNAFWQSPDISAWRTAARQAQAGRLRANYMQAGVAAPTDLDAAFRNSPNNSVDNAEFKLTNKYGELTAGKDAEQTAQIARDFNGLYTDLQTLRSQGIFTSLVEYEAAVGRQAIESAFSLNFMGGLSEVINARHNPAAAPDAEFSTMRGVGVVPALFLMLRGKQWLVTQHFFFFLLFAAGALAIWALIGGAICRIAALNVAREERLSPRAGLQFAARKYLSFLTAPLMPVALIAVVGILLFLGGVVMAWLPYIGEILGGLLLPLGLLGGFVIALVVVGGLVGSHLFYPTIAVEGSDSFDAMSRSYSYVYSRPWRTIWYCLVAFLYGSLCYLFVRFFALIMLKATRAFMNLGTAPFTDRPGTGIANASKLDAMWANPTFDSLRSAPAPFGMVHLEPAGAWLIGLWVLLVIALLAAFVVSFYFCASTIIYSLLRREVDATDLEEVYVDEEEEEAGAATGVAAPGAAGESPAGSAAPISPPPAEPPVSEPPPSDGGQPTP